MVRRYWKPALAVLTLALVALPPVLVRTADASSCRHNCRCSRLDYFDRLLPSGLPGHGGDALGSVQRTVGLLLADPATDWSEVRVSRLREHLVDLNALMMSAEAQERHLEDGLEITVGGEGIHEALRRVVPEHVRRMDGFRGWRIRASEDGGEGMKLTLTSAAPEEVEIIRALGFFGFLSTGVHRPESHIAIVRGKSPS